MRKREGAKEVLTGRAGRERETIARVPTIETGR